MTPFDNAQDRLRPAQGEREPRCFLCGATEKVAEAHPHNWLCEECWPVGDHTVRMSNGGGQSIAECQCGWRSEVAWANRATVQEAKVRLHWRDVIRRFDAEFGDGAAARELVGGLALFVFLACDAVGAVLLIEAIGRAS